MQRRARVAGECKKDLFVKRNTQSLTNEKMLQHLG